MVIRHGVPRGASNPMFYGSIGADSWEWFEGCKGRHWDPLKFE